jgi:two-component system, cell cycle sensor histidine kinase and response regulator CckA
MRGAKVDEKVRSPLVATRPLGTKSNDDEQLEQLRQAQKMEVVGQLACGVAHDFNNLLTAILGNLTLLQNGLPPGDPLQPLVEASERAAWRAATLSRQLLGYARRSRPSLEPLVANSIINEVVSLLKRTMDPRIVLLTRCATDLWLIQADPNQLSQVLMNLCLNARDAVQPRLEGTRTLARKAVEAPGQANAKQRATIKLESANVALTTDNPCTLEQARQGEFIRLRVRDNGIGMTAEAQTRIFEPFFTTKEPGKGTGLGLAMAQGIVQQHHGWIECQSILGEGTCFDIYLPRTHVLAGPRSPRALPHKSARGHETILLADDESLVRNLGRTILESHGYQVLLAHDGQHALEVYRRERGRIDLVLLDLTMPRLSGRETMRQLRQLDSSVRVLFASGYSAEHLTAEDREVACGFVGKPYRPEDLALAVRAALDRHLAPPVAVPS